MLWKLKHVGSPAELGERYRLGLWCIFPHICSQLWSCFRKIARLAHLVQKQPRRTEERVSSCRLLIHEEVRATGKGLADRLDDKIYLLIANIQSSS